MRQILEPMCWAQQQFGQCDLGDVRRTQRLIKFATQVAGNPSSNTPMQTEKWADCKAAYRLIDQPAVTFQAITEPHFQLTKTEATGFCLLLHDTTEIDYGYESGKAGLGFVGSGSDGFHLHSALVVLPDGQVLGLAGQRIRHRKPAPRGESRAERLRRDRESLLWGKLIDQVGPPPDNAKWINVCDRGADHFEVFCKMLQNRHNWVNRASHLKRNVLYQGQRIILAKVVDQLPLAGNYTLSYRTAEKGMREAEMEVRYGRITMPKPQLQSPWLKATGITTINMNLVIAKEVNPPKNVKPLNWLLLTSLPVNRFEDAWKIIEYYERRWIIEEYHKALKTGCSIEKRQYRTKDRLEAISGLLAIVAVRLLQLRSAATTDPQQEAKKIIPSIWLTALRALRPHATIETVGQFYRQLAGLGGHLLRKGDGNPGWLTIWRGFTLLHLAIKALRGIREKCG